MTSRQCPRASDASPPADDWLVVTVPSEIDVANAAQVLADLRSAIDSGNPVVVADMSMTAFCDCAGVSALRAAGGYAAQASAELRVVARSAPVLRMFVLTGLDVELAVYPSRSAALRGSGATRRGQPGATVIRLSSQRRTDRAVSGPQPDRQRCP